jgi:multidrug efflux pump subunit AcrA (membrane-fusion protein)
MSVYLEALGSYLGKNVEDIHGRASGRIVGIAANSKNEVTEIQLEIGTGELKTLPITQFELEKGTPVVLPQWKVEANEIQREYLTASRRLSAVDLLLKDGDISKDAYQEMKDTYANAIEQIDSRRTKLAETLTGRKFQLEQQIRELQTALTNNKMLYSSREITEAAYKEVVDSIRAALTKSRTEKTDIEETEAMIAKVESTPPPTIASKSLDSYVDPPEAPVPIPSIQPPRIPDVVVVKVREEPAT